MPRFKIQIRLGPVLIAAAVLIVASIVGKGCNDKWREFDARAERAVEDARVARAWADSVRDASDARVAWSDSTAAVLRDRLARARARVDSVRDTLLVIVDSAQAIAVRDSIIADLDDQVVGWTAAYDTLVTAFAALRVGYDSLLVVNDSLINVLDDRPRPRQWWTPSLQAGVFAGVCTDGKPCAGVGAGLTVEVKIPVRMPWDGS